VTPVSGPVNGSVNGSVNGPVSGQVGVLVVVPTYNEVDNLEPLLERIRADGGTAHGFGSDARTITPSKNAPAATAQNV